MKVLSLMFVVIALAFSALRADDAVKADKDSGAAGTATEQYKANPDDTKASTAWLNETFTEIVRLMEPSPDLAEKKLAAAKEFLSTLTPESAAGKANLTRAKSLVTTYEGNLELARLTLADFEKLLDDKPGDAALLMKYSRKVSMELSSIARTDPDKADEKLKLVKARVEKLKEGEPDKAALSTLERTLTVLANTIKNAQKLLALIGQPAPELQIESWTNGSPLTSDELKGKVVLLDFWAIWCGPCIATFPHLREWQETYSDKGLVIVGMTRYYNYGWDEATSKPIRGKEKDEVSNEDEQVMLKHFAEFHKLEHRFAIQGKDSTSSADFAVTGIPHVVLIDRQGVIRLIKVGSGPANAKAIHDMIEKLLADKPVATK